MEALASICSDTQSPVVQGSKSVASMEDYKPFCVRDLLHSVTRAKFNMFRF